MPYVHVHVVRGRPASERRSILDGVHAALVEAFRVPDDSVNQLLHEHDPENVDSSKGAAFTLVEMTVFPGRSAEAKRRLYSALVRNLALAPGIPADKVTVVLHEPPFTDWGIRGGKAAADLDLGFKVDV